MSDESLRALERAAREAPDDKVARYRLRCELVRLGRQKEAGFAIGDRVSCGDMGILYVDDIRRESDITKDASRPFWFAPQDHLMILLRFYPLEQPAQLFEYKPWRPSGTCLLVEPVAPGRGA